MNGFRFARARAVFWKDWLDLRKNRGLLASMIVLPAIMVVVPALVVAAYAAKPDDVSLRVMAQYYDATVMPERAAQFMIERILADWLGLFLVMPVFVPILISSQSVAGEKEKRTLEPLLASPVTAAELFVGKSLAALVPAVVVSWVAFGVMCVLVDVAAWPLTQAAVLPNGMWLFGVGVLAPLFAFFGNGIAVLISARVTEARMAQQLSALFVLPLVGLTAGQFVGFLEAGLGYYALEGAVILALDVILVVASVRLFDRERMLSRWV